MVTVAILCHTNLKGSRSDLTLISTNADWVIAIIVASIIGAFLSTLLHVSLYYRFQFAKWGIGNFNYLRNRILFPKSPNFQVMQQVGIGFFITAILTVLKRRFIWWPFYPAGYAVCR